MPNTAAPRTLDARPDPVDFRDRLYVPTLVEVPPRIDLADYTKWGVPVLDQKREGACTGFGLATVAHYLLRRRQVDADGTEVSPRMLYEMAKRYDEWKGEAYEGSSARAAVKGWHHHGVCSAALWPYRAKQVDRRLNDARAFDASRRPLGAYYRVDHSDLVSMHTALAEVGILYVTAVVHAGWQSVRRDGAIPLTGEPLGGHAFAIVAYDARGFWIQNSWGTGWGRGGLGFLTYDDWLLNGTDAWVTRLGAPVIREPADGAAKRPSRPRTRPESLAYADLRPHIVSLGNDGRLDPFGTYANTEDDLDELFRQDFRRVTHHWPKKRLLLYAHGGLVDEATAIAQLGRYVSAFLPAEVYPVGFAWHTGFWDTLGNLLEETMRRRRPEGLWDRTKEFLLDRLDDTLEPLARPLGKTMWDEMKENADRACRDEKGGARLVAAHVDRLMAEDPDVELHIAGHSAGSIFHAPLVQLLTTRGRITSGPLAGETGYGRKAATCTLWAPACTLDLFRATYLPAIRSGAIGRFALFDLTDRAERDDDCVGAYHKSLLYLVSRAFEAGRETPLLGMELFARRDPDIKRLLERRRIDWVACPNEAAGPGSPDRSLARHHKDFSSDTDTLRATLARILGVTRLRTEIAPARDGHAPRMRGAPLVRVA